MRSPEVGKDGMKFPGWIETFAADWVRANPQAATTTQYFSPEAQDAIDRRLEAATWFGMAIGESEVRARAERARSGLEALKAISVDESSEDERCSAQIVKWNLENAAANEQFAMHGSVFNSSPFVGLQSSLVGFMMTLHPLRNVCDAENYLERLSRIAPLLDAGIADARAAAACGILPPRCIVESAIAQIATLIQPSAADHVLVTTFIERARRAGSIDERTIGALAPRIAALLAQRIFPALERVHTMLREQMTGAPEAVGVSRLPDGEGYYARRLAAETGTTLSAQDIHAIGLREVERIEAEMDRVLRELGYRSGTLEERLRALNGTDREATNPDPREAIVAKIGRIVDDAVVRSHEAFDVVPRARCIVAREPAFSESAAAAHYQPPPPDGSSPGVYFIPLPNLDPNMPWLGINLRSTAYHEAVPGHHFQMAIQQETPTLPRFRKSSAFGYMAAFIEGWALYAEQLCDENGWYADDLPGRLGYLNLQLFRAKRLVVDTAIHTMGWTREQGIGYGFPAAEIERYITWPGQACSYTIGFLRILEVRERARARLGASFNVKAFHNRVLRGGTMPLDVFASHFDHWTGDDGAERAARSASPG